MGGKPFRSRRAATMAPRFYGSGARQDTSLRRMMHGPIRPMEEPTLLERLARVPRCLRRRKR